MAKTGQTHRRIHKIKIGEGQTAEAAIAYLADAQANGDYYTEGGSAVMLWLATDRARTYFGLGPRGGEVSRVTMAALLNGLNPVTGAKIRKEGQDGTMVGGTDVVLNPAPKSVSVLWAVAGDELRRTLETTVYASATQALRRMLYELPMVREKIPGTNLARHVRAEDWVAVQAIHTTARLTAHKGVPDPQLHVHNVLFGALTFDGRIKALDSLPMTRYHRELDAEAASVLAEELRLMGFPIRRVIMRNSLGGIKSVKFELDGVPESLIEAMSARSQEIGDLRKQYEKATGRPAEGPGWEKFAGEHRGAKAKLSPAEMHAAWHGEAGEHGFDQVAVAKYVRRATEARASGIEKRDQHGWAAEQLRREILDELCREHALVPEAELNRLVMQLSIGLMRPVPAWRVLAKMAGAGDLLRSTDGMVTTLEVLAAEQRATRAAQQLLDAAPGPAADPRELEREYRHAEEEGRPFDDGQRQAVALAVGGGRLVSISGRAGTGKSNASDAMTAIWQRQGRRVIASAVQGITAQKAAADSGADSARTLAGLLVDVVTGKLRLQSSDVVFVDEAGMIGHRQYAPLLEAIAEAGATLVQVGDDRQLAPLEAGGLWTVTHRMAEEEGLAAELREVHRARSPEERRAWDDLYDGRVEEALMWYRDQGLLRLYGVRAQLLEGMLEEWWATEPDRGVMVVDSSNEERDELNTMAQTRRLEAGELGAEALPLESGRALRAGDRVLFNDIYRPSADEGARSWPKRVENGTSATVMSVDAAAETAVLRLHEPKPKRRRTAGAKSQTVTLPEQDRELTVTASAPIDLGYARHVYKAQGMTADVANVATGPYTDHNKLYVMVTRSRDGTRIHALQAEVEEMGAEPAVLQEPPAAPAGVTSDELVAGLPLWEQEWHRDRDDHLYPSERRELEQTGVAHDPEELPPGATLVRDFFAEPAERVAVPRERPEVWAAIEAATVVEMAGQAKRSSTKHAIGRKRWNPRPDWEGAVEAGATNRETVGQRDWPADVEGQAHHAVGMSLPRVRPDRQPAPASLPGREALDTAARDHARWCDAPKVLASYEVAGRLDIAADPVEQAARRWLADPAAVIVVADQEQEQLVRDAVARLRSVSPAGPSDSPATERSRQSQAGTLDDRQAGTDQVAARDLNMPSGADAYARGLAALPPHAVQIDEPRVYTGAAAYQEREARRRALGLGSSHPGIEPDVEPRAYVVAPAAPGSGWSYSDMTRALSVGARTHLISPEPNKSTARDAQREVSDLRRGLAAHQRAEQLRQAAMRENLADLDRRRAREMDGARDRHAERNGALR